MYYFTVIFVKRTLQKNEGHIKNQYFSMEVCFILGEMVIFVHIPCYIAEGRTHEEDSWQSILGDLSAFLLKVLIQVSKIIHLLVHLSLHVGVVSRKSSNSNSWMRLRNTQRED